MTLHGVQFNEFKIGEFCRNHGVARLSLFGSILRHDFTPASDIDLLIEFLPGVRVSPSPRSRSAMARTASLCFEPWARKTLYPSSSTELIRAPSAAALGWRTALSRWRRPRRVPSIANPRLR